MDVTIATQWARDVHSMAVHTTPMVLVCNYLSGIT